MLEKDIYASHIYQSIVRNKFPGENPLSEINDPFLQKILSQS